MAKLEWDKFDERLYEIGIDRGVLYFPSSPRNYDNGVAWNGLTGVSEEFADDITKPLYFDGIKFLDTYFAGDLLIKLNAITYPDEFMEFEGYGNMGDGAQLDDQRPKVFGLSYRTRIGNFTEGIEHGYKIHILYNLTPISDEPPYLSQTDTVEPISFSWTMYGAPEIIPGFKPTAHAIFDSRYTRPDILAFVEDILYGRDAYTNKDDLVDGFFPWTVADDEVDGGTTISAGEPPDLEGNLIELPPINPRLPPLSVFINIATNLNPRDIIPQTNSGLARLVAGDGDLSQTNTEGIYIDLPATRLVETEIPGIFILAGGVEE